MEANAILADRIIYSASDIASCEGEQYLRDKSLSGEESIFNLLKRPWDYWDRYTNDNVGMGNRDHCYQAGTFLHYMRTYRSGTKLDPVYLLKNTPAFGSWRSYLAKYIQDNLGSTIGDEYDAYVKMLFSGEKPEFNLLSQNENRMLEHLINMSFRSYLLSDNFCTYIKYKFAETDNTPVKQTVNLNLPYLSSKVVVIDNLSTAKNRVVLNYKRLHAPAAGHKVYFAQFDASSKQFNYTDITDSLSYSVLLNSWWDNYDVKNREQEFILLVNKDNPSWGSSNFNASFELTATPLMDIENIVSVGLEGTSFSMPGGEELAATAAVFTNFEKTVSTTTQLQGASTLLIHADYSYQYTTGHVTEGMINRRTIQHTQQFEYNFVTGEFKIAQTRTQSDLWDFYDFRKDSYGHYQPVFPPHTEVRPVETNQWTVHLKGITKFDKVTSAPGMVAYLSESASEARNNVVSATNNGVAVDVSGVTQASMATKIK